MDDQEIGALLQWWRLKRDYSVRALSRKTALHHSYLSRMESGERPLSLEHAAKLDEYLVTESALVRAVQQSPSEGAVLLGSPEQLPPREALIDRRELLESVSAALGDDDGDSRSAALLGPGGIGKTAIAVAIAYRVRTQYEGVLWYDLRGWDELTGPRSPESVLRSWCAVAGPVATSDLPSGLDDLMALWRSITAQRRYLIGIDNARSEQIAPLMPASAGSVTLITSRERVLQVPGPVYWFSVPPLHEEDAAMLVAHRSGRPVHRVSRLAARGAGLPLALRSLGDYLGAHDEDHDEEMIDDMATEAASLDAVRESAERSYRELTDEQALAWRLCATLPEASPAAAAAATGLPEEQVRPLLKAASDVSLLSKQGRTFHYHELHRAVALEKSQRVDAQAVRDASAERSMLFMLHGWANAATALTPDRSSGPPLNPTPPTVNPPAFDSFDSALMWAETHWEYIPLTVRRAIERGWTRLSWQLVACSFAYAMIVQPWGVAYDLAQRAAAHTERVGDREGLAWMYHLLGYMDTQQLRLDESIDYLSRALDLRRALSDPSGIGWSAQVLGRAYLLRGDDPDTARGLLDEAIDALDSLDVPSDAASARSLRGTVYLGLDELAHADEDLTRAVEALPVGGDPLLHCYAYSRLASVRLQQQRLEPAEELARHAAEYAAEHSAQYSEVDALEVLGRVLLETGDVPGARAAWSHAIEIADYLNAPETERIEEHLHQLDTQS